MDEDRKIEGALRRLYGRVDPTGAWADIEARAAGRKARKLKLESDVQYVRSPQVRSSRLRWAVYMPLALFLVAGIAIGTVFAVDQSQQQAAVTGGNGSGLQPGTEGAQTSTTIPPAADYSRGGKWKRLAVSGAGGLVSGLAMDPADSQVLYAVTQEGLYKTSDGAGSWRKVLESGGEVAVDPVSPSTVYVVVLDAKSPKIRRSDDSGASWTELDSSVLLDSKSKSEYVWDGGSFGPPVTVGAANASTIYMDTDSGVWRSVDRGASWSKVTRNEMTQKTVAGWSSGPAASPLGLYGKKVEDMDDGSSGVVEVAVADPGDSSVIYAGTMGGGVFKSVDSGATWHRSSTGMTSSPVYGFVPDPVSPSVLYASTDSGIQKSANGGATWSLILAGGQYMGDFVDLGNGRGSQSTGMPSVVVAPSSPSTLYAWNGEGISRSEDGGAIWSHRAGEGLLTAGSKPTGNTGRLALVCAADPDVLFAGADGGLFRSADGGDTWAKLTGMYDAWEVIADPKQASVLYVTGTLEPRKPPTREESKNHTRNTPPSYLFKSVDAGATWKLIVNVREVGITSQLCFDGHDPAQMYSRGTVRDSETLGAKLMRSVDGGVTWQQVDFSALGEYFEQPLFDPRSPDTVYARVATLKGEDYSLVGVFRSTDGGVKWNNIIDELVAGDTSLTIAISPSDGTLYATSPRGLFKWAPKD
jgi:photosystem II stability/assembly factor-like uncharacterized protein